MPACRSSVRGCRRRAGRSGQPKNVTSVTARRKLEKEENAPFPWKPNSVKPVRMDPRNWRDCRLPTRAQPCPPGFVDCWPCPEQGCNERHATDRQLATHVRLVHDDGKWRCPFYPSRVQQDVQAGAPRRAALQRRARGRQAPHVPVGRLQPEFFLNRGGLMQHYNFIHLKRNDRRRGRASANGSANAAAAGAAQGAEAQARARPLGRRQRRRAHERRRRRRVGVWRPGRRLVRATAAAHRQRGRVGAPQRVDGGAAAPERPRKVDSRR
jgi:hypothetical protein